MKHSKKKSIVSLLLCFVMLVGMIAFPSDVNAKAKNAPLSTDIERTDWGSASVTTTIYYTGGATEGDEFTVNFEGTAANAEAGYIKVNAEKTGQTMLGIGGAMTESAGYNLQKLSEEKQAEVIEAYYGESGAKYSLTRSSIGSADFSLRGYSYCDEKGSKGNELANFSIANDYDYIIPGIKQILNTNPDVKFFAAIWSPPAWMKNSNKRAGGTALAGSWITNQNAVKTEYYQTYADYLVKYCKAYAAEGIPVYCLSMQNESQNHAAWECCTWTTKQAISFLGSYLGPTLKSQCPDTQLAIWDWDKGNDTLHKDGMIKYCNTVLADKNVQKYVDAVAFHWYAGDLWHEISGTPMWSEDFDSLDSVKAANPDIHLYGTEACEEKGPWFGEIEPARRYTHDVLTDFEHGAESFIDWNLLLDSEGGPTHDVTNQCHAPIMLDENNNVVYQPSYYVLKQISRAVQPGTVHVESATDLSLDKTAVMDDNGNVSLLVGNTGETDTNIYVGDSVRRIEVAIPAHSITTITFNKELPEIDTKAHLQIGYPQADGTYSVEEVEADATDMLDLTSYVKDGYLYAGQYTDNTFTTPAENPECGVSVAEYAGKTYYIKTISEKYLTPKTLSITSGSESDKNSVCEAYLFFGIDNDQYVQIGYQLDRRVLFKVTENELITEIYDYVNLRDTSGTLRKCFTVTDLDSSLKNGSLCFTKIFDGNEVPYRHTLRPFYVTNDDVKVYGPITRTTTIQKDTVTINNKKTKINVLSNTDKQTGVKYVDCNIDPEEEEDIETINSLDLLSTK